MANHGSRGRPLPPPEPVPGGRGVVVDLAGPGVVLAPVGVNAGLPVVGVAGWAVAGVEVAPDGVDVVAGVVLAPGDVGVTTGVPDGLGEGAAVGPGMVGPPQRGAVTTLVSRVTAPFSA